MPYTSCVGICSNGGELIGVSIAPNLDERLDSYWSYCACRTMMTRAKMIGNARGARCARVWQGIVLRLSLYCSEYEMQIEIARYEIENIISVSHTIWQINY